MGVWPNLDHIVRASSMMKARVRILGSVLEYRLPAVWAGRLTLHWGETRGKAGVALARERAR